MRRFAGGGFSATAATATSTAAAAAAFGDESRRRDRRCRVHARKFDWRRHWAHARIVVAVLVDLHSVCARIVVVVEGELDFG